VSGRGQRIAAAGAVSGRAQRIAATGADRLARATGLRVGRHVARFMAEDAWANARYFAHPAARRAERAQAQRVHTVDECFEFSRAHFGGGPVQHRSEIAGLLTLAADNGTRAACEIGAFDAGTSVMLSRALDLDTLIVMDLYVRNRWRLRSAAPSQQKVHVIDGDSGHARTVRRLQGKLKGRKLDLLLIDGDHSWHGVRQDFLRYREFVRDGGLIAFHDICQVSEPGAPGWSGDVPEFWRLISSIYENDEFVDSPGQQGLGIGVIRYDQTRSIAPVLDAVSPPA
jgi:predicted O-methyltransferase YrrM